MLLITIFVLYSHFHFLSLNKCANCQKKKEITTELKLIICPMAEQRTQQKHSTSSHFYRKSMANRNNERHSICVAILFGVFLVLWGFFPIATVCMQWQTKATVDCKHSDTCARLFMCVCVFLCVDRLCESIKLNFTLLLSKTKKLQQQKHNILIDAYLKRFQHRAVRSICQKLIDVSSIIFFSTEKTTALDQQKQE